MGIRPDFVCLIRPSRLAYFPRKKMMLSLLLLLLLPTTTVEVRAMSPREPTTPSTLTAMAGALKVNDWNIPVKYTFTPEYHPNLRICEFCCP